MRVSEHVCVTAIMQQYLRVTTLNMHLSLGHYSVVVGMSSNCLDIKVYNCSGI